MNSCVIIYSAFSDIYINYIDINFNSTIEGLPVLDESAPSSGLQFFGRIFLVLLFCTLLHFWGFAKEGSKEKVNLADPIEELTGVKSEMINDLFGIFFIFLIAVGWRTRLTSVVLIIWLGVLNFFVNDFWSHKERIRTNWLIGIRSGVGITGYAVTWVTVEPVGYAFFCEFP